MTDKLTQSIANLGRALDRLEEALAEPTTNKLAIDGTIQRFEFGLELFWKTLKRLLAAEGIESSTPRETLKHAYRIGWLSNEAAWLQMLRDRNETSHVYNEEMATRIYESIRTNFPEMQSAYRYIANRLNQTASSSTSTVSSSAG